MGGQTTRARHTPREVRRTEKKGEREEGERLEGERVKGEKRRGVYSSHLTVYVCVSVCVMSNRECLVQ